MISEIILKTFPRLRKSFTKYTYFYMACVFFLFQYYLYKNQYYWLILFIALCIVGYMLYENNKQLIGNEDTDFVELERRMRVLIPEDEPLNNHLYVNPNLLEFLYSIRGFKLTDKKNFDEMIIRINRFLAIYEKVTDAKKVTNHNLEDLHILKTQILNCFHSILYKLVNDREMNRHNEIRFVLEEKINELYDDCLEFRTGFVTFNDYGYNPNFNAHYDIY